MGRLTCMLALAFLLATASWAPSASADVNVEEVELPLGNPNIFPYCNCDRTAGTYTAGPNIVAVGNGTYCFTINVPKTCEGLPIPNNKTCCSSELKKIEFNVYRSCAVNSATVKATINGKFTKTGPFFTKYADTNATVLKLTNLDMNISSDGSLVCIQLIAGKNNTGCDTVEELCIPPAANLGPGSCRVALFGTNEQSGCCPTNTIVTPRPPSPRPPSPRPPSPRPPSPGPPPCKLCIKVDLLPPLYDFPPYRFTNASCIALQSLLVSQLNAKIANLSGSMNPMIQPFAVDPASCSPTAVSICGVFFSEADSLLLKSFIEFQFDVVIGLVLKEACTASRSYTVRMSTGEQDCFFLESIKSCLNEPPPFPDCKCNQSKGITPFYALPDIATKPGRTVGTTQYCFSVGSVPPMFMIPGPCSTSTVMSKAEIWADSTKKTSLKGVKVTPNGGSAVWPSISWTGNSLKATPLNWSIALAAGGEICIELNKTLSLDDFCLGSSCYVSLFNDSKKCCPTYAADL